MLKLQKQRTEPEWIELLGARFLMAPITRAMHRRARSAAFSAAQAAGADAADAEFGEAVGDGLTEALLLEGMLEWEGVGDAAGEPLPCTAENKRMLLEDPARFDALDAVYVVPFALRLAEGNGSVRSPNGTGAAATPAGATAGSRAKPKANRGATDAPIASTRRKPPRAKKSGQR